MMAVNHVSQACCVREAFALLSQCRKHHWVATQARVFDSFADGPEVFICRNKVSRMSRRLSPAAQQDGSVGNEEPYHAKGACAGERAAFRIGCEEIPARSVKRRRWPELHASMASRGSRCGSRILPEQWLDA